RPRLAMADEAVAPGGGHGGCTIADRRAAGQWRCSRRRSSTRFDDTEGAQHAGCRLWAELLEGTARQVGTADAIVLVRTVLGDGARSHRQEVDVGFRARYFRARVVAAVALRDEAPRRQGESVC